MTKPEQSYRQWVSGLGITLTGLVCLFGFWRITPGATFVISSVSFIALVVFFWSAGRNKRN